MKKVALVRSPHEGRTFESPEGHFVFKGQSEW